MNNDTGGTVTFDTAPASGVIVTLRQEVPLDQPSALPNQGPFPSQTVETQIADRIVMQNKQQQEELDRSVKVAVSSTLTELDLTPAPGQFVAWNQAGDALIGTDATPNTVPVSTFGATLVDDPDASAALTTLGYSDYVKNNLIASSSADAHLTTLLPAIDTVLETTTGLVDVGVFHPAIDEHPEWYDGVTGARSRFMMVTAQTAGGNSTVKIWDLTVATPVVLQSETLNNSVVSAISDIKGGVIAIATEDGLFRRGWTRTGFGTLRDGLPDPITSSTVPALTNNDLDDVCIGYSDRPAANPATSGKKPTIGGIYGTGADAAFILKDDGQSFDQAGTVGDVGCGISVGWFYYSEAPASHRMITTRISEITGDDWAQFIFLENDQDPYGFGADNGFDITPAQDFAGASVDGLTIGKVLGDNREVDERFTALVNRTYTTGWLVGDIRGAWLANSKTLDRSYLGNALTENGTIVEADAATDAELKVYSGFSDANYLSRAYDADLDLGTGDYYVVLWIKATTPTGTDTVIHRDDASGNNPNYRLEINSSGHLIWNWGVRNGTAHALSTASVGINFADDQPHLVLATRRGDTTYLFVDGREIVNTGAGGAQTLTSGTALLYIGRHLSITPSGADTTATALLRIGLGTVSDAQFRHMYETERRLFEVNAKCLLQSSTSDAVQSVAIDPVTSDLFVGQADSLQRFQGLSVAAVRLAASETWTSDDHKGIRAAGGALLLANAAESYASAPAIDLRDELAAEDLGARPDPSKAGAWVEFSGSASATIRNAFNIRSVTRTDTGDYTIVFATPFKVGPAVSIASGQPNNILASNPGRDQISVTLTDAANTPADSSSVNVICFGELEDG